MVFASILGVILSGFVLIIIMIGVGSAIVGMADKDDKLEVKENSILNLSFKNGVVDQASNDPFESFDFNTMKSKKQLGLRDVLQAIEKAKDDDKIKGIYLAMADSRMNLANLDEVRKALVDFKSSGKFTIAYGESVNQAQYYLASACDKVYLFQEGDLSFAGLSSEIMFYKGALEKMDVEVQVIRGSNNKFKSAVEPFIYDKMSEANREQATKYMTGIWGQWTQNIAESRGLTVERVNQIADSVSTYDPKEALESGMIDGLKYGDEVLAELMSLVEVEDEDDLNMISISKYARAPKKKDEDDTKSWKIKDKVAIIYAAGDIVSGSSSNGSMGSKTIAAAIKKARKDTTVKAIVLRVNSPGGSALASDVMWRETQLAKAEKPFVVSMGGLAASGGYYIACGAHRIFAGPNTITGSIGVFGMIPYAGEFFTNKLGITFDGVQTNANSDAGSMVKKLTPYQYNRIQKGVDKIYDTFISHVSEGRGLTKAEVDEIGQGRVWTGKDALELGLVDELGGLNDAVAHAVKLAELEEGKYRVKSYPEQKDPFEAFMEELSGKAMTKMFEWQIGEEYKYLKPLQDLTKRETIQARMPYDLVIR